MTEKTNLNLIYQMGRVGSKSHESVLKKSNLENVIHIHSLNPTRIINLNNKFTKLKPNNYDPLHKLGINLGNSILLEPYKFNIKTVCPIRDVISRNFSSFMYTTHFWQSKKREEIKNIKDLSLFFENEFYHRDILNWFDSEIFSILQQNVYDHIFDKDHLIIENEFGWKTIIYKFDISNDRKSELLSNFFNKNIKFDKKINGNKKDTIWQNMNYSELKKEIKLSKYFVDKINSSQYMTHFWSKKEIDKIRSNWI